MYCPEHRDAPIIEVSGAGDQICSECGLVLAERSLRVGPEWNTFNKDEIPGSSSQRHVGGSLSASEIGSEVHTQVEAECTSNSSFKSRKTKSTRNQALNQTLKELSEMGERLNASRSVVERAQTIFKTVQEGNLLKGRPSDAIAAACLHLACRQEDVGRTFKEMCAVSKVSKKEIGRCTKLLESALGTTLVPKSSVVCAADFIPRVCSNLSLPVEVQNAALDIARKSTDLDTVMGRSPVSVSAAAIYMASQASNVKKSPKEIGSSAGVADRTIIECYKSMRPHAGVLFPKDFQFHTTVEQLPYHK